MKAHNFTLPDHTGQLRSLNDFAGSWVVLYFYPKDNTPSCTVEACSLRDAQPQLAALGAKVIGVSRDDAKEHQAFMTAHNLNFTLLTDADVAVAKTYGAWGKKVFGREGVLRKTFIINPQGEIVKVFGRVVSLGHGPQVVTELKRLQDLEK